MVIVILLITYYYILIAHAAIIIHVDKIIILQFPGRFNRNNLAHYVVVKNGTTLYNTTHIHTQIVNIIYIYI